jgi:hypothetical protein
MVRERDFEQDRHRSQIGRLAAAVGVAAIVALLFVMMLPASPQSDARSSFQASVQQFSAVLSQQHPVAVVEDAAKPALAEFQSLLTATTASADPAQAAPAPADNKLLQQFMPWRRKGNSPETAQ